MRKVENEGEENRAVSEDGTLQAPLVKRLSNRIVLRGTYRGLVNWGSRQFCLKHLCCKHFAMQLIVLRQFCCKRIITLPVWFAFGRQLFCQFVFISPLTKFSQYSYFYII